jgi:hypothetical protein
MGPADPFAVPAPRQDRVRLHLLELDAAVHARPLLLRVGRVAVLAANNVVLVLGGFCRFLLRSLFDLFPVRRSVSGQCTVGLSAGGSSIYYSRNSCSFFLILLRISAFFARRITATGAGFGTPKRTYVSDGG